MTWDEVHEIAEELEHIQSDRLIERLDNFLGHPKFDPHGDPIPNEQGRYTLRAQIPLSSLASGQSGMIIGVKEDDSPFLKHLNDKGVGIGKVVRVLTIDDYDHGLLLQMEGDDVVLSCQVADHILVKPMV
jgi:DtxR family Mn-dependent transcriptional regulator